MDLPALPAVPGASPQPFRANDDARAMWQAQRNALQQPMDEESRWLLAQQRQQAIDAAQRGKGQRSPAAKPTPKDAAAGVALRGKLWAQTLARRSPAPAPAAGAAARALAPAASSVSAPAAPRDRAAPRTQLVTQAQTRAGGPTQPSTASTGGPAQPQAHGARRHVLTKWWRPSYAEGAHAR